MVDLHLIPEIFQRDDFCFVSLGHGNVLREGYESECKQENERALYQDGSFLSCVFQPRMARIKLFLAAEIPKLPVLDKGPRRIGQPNCRLRGYGDCAKIEVLAVA